MSSLENGFCFVLIIKVIYDHKEKKEKKKDHIKLESESIWQGQFNGYFSRLYFITYLLVLLQK